MSLKRSRLWAELNGENILFRLSAGMPLPWSVMVRVIVWLFLLLVLLVLVVLWVSSTLLPFELAWMAFLSGAVIR